jgi:hypothetical protein
MKIALGCALVIACVTMASAQVLEVAGRTAQSGGPCDCPENLKSNGDECGRVSAYCRCGGRDPTCYPDDHVPVKRRVNMMKHCGHYCEYKAMR